MKAFNFFKVDCLRCKTQLLLITGMMLFFALFFTFQSGDILFACGYLSFLAVMFSVQPFTMDQISESGFINMLPGNTNDRVYGRFMYTTMVLGMSILISLSTIALYVGMGNTMDSTKWAILTALLGGILTMTSIQILILYSLGKGKSQQFMTLVNMVPAIIMFIAVKEIIDYITEHPEFDISWIIDHKNMAAGVVLGFGLVLFLITIQIAKIIVRKRDFE